ncbi:hypothetical protein ELQ87_12285 [Streptomyces griseoviridis]|uniref:Uncharacterized protein n=1 Tax=Streptomyces griseoviridis TaxID=45398 RepID=A0A3Q9KUS6_STRGD|nr:hypothetical protein ELQ87_12285 [Streptomyces griseoviridis]QCN88170.1 hypothetical protein DDJ31_27020 [Streptomyces griseoviridis]
MGPAGPVGAVCPAGAVGPVVPIGPVGPGWWAGRSSPRRCRWPVVPSRTGSADGAFLAVTRQDIPVTRGRARQPSSPGTSAGVRAPAAARPKPPRRPARRDRPVTRRALPVRQRRSTARYFTA